MSETALSHCASSSVPNSECAPSVDRCASGNSGHPLAPPWTWLAELTNFNKCTESPRVPMPRGDLPSSRSSFGVERDAGLQFGIAHEEPRRPAGRPARVRRTLSADQRTSGSLPSPRCRPGPSSFRTHSNARYAAISISPKSALWVCSPSTTVKATVFSLPIRIGGPIR